LSRSVSGKEYIAVFIDAFTRWPEAVAIPDKNVTSVVRVVSSVHLLKLHSKREGKEGLAFIE
jgi:hypothetical protein